MQYQNILHGILCGHVIPGDLAGWARTACHQEAYGSTRCLAWQRSEPPHRSGADPFRLSPTVGWALSLEAS